MVFRVHKTKNYTVMSNYHLSDKNLTLKAKGLLSVMLSLPDTWNYSIAGLVAICKENETAITSALNELEDAGYIIREKRMPKSVINEDGTKEVVRSRVEYVYNIFEEPTLDRDFLGVENLGVEILGQENPVQLSTKQSNTNKINNTKVLGIGKPIPDTPIEETSNNENPLTEFQSHAYSENDVREERKQARRRVRVEDEQPKKKSLYAQCLEELDKRSNFTPEEKEALKVYLPVRLGLKDKPLVGVNMWKGLLNLLSRMSGDRVHIVQYSTVGGYASFYENCGRGGYTNKQRLATFGEDEHITSNKVAMGKRSEVFISGEQV